MGRLSEYYDNPLEFRPERWLDADGNELAVKPKAFAPFHAGPRTCLGKDMVGERYPIPITITTTTITLPLIKSSSSPSPSLFFFFFFF